MQYIPRPPYMGYGLNSMVPTIGGGYNYYNAEAYRKQQQELIQRQQKEQENQINIWKTLIRNNEAWYGNNYSQEQLDNYFDALHEAYTQYNDNTSTRNELFDLREKVEKEQLQKQIWQQQKEEYFANMQAENNDETLLEFLRGSCRERYIESMESKILEANRNIRALYDSDGYNRLLGVHESSFNSLNPYVTVDDMEVGIPPEMMSKEREMRRRRFIETIMMTDQRR